MGAKKSGGRKKLRLPVTPNSFYNVPFVVNGFVALNLKFFAFCDSVAFLLSYFSHLTLFCLFCLVSVVNLFVCVCLLGHLHHNRAYDDLSDRHPAFVLLDQLYEGETVRPAHVTVYQLHVTLDKQHTAKPRSKHTCQGGCDSVSDADCQLGDVVVSTVPSTEPITFSQECSCMTCALQRGLPSFNRAFLAVTS